MPRQGLAEEKHAPGLIAFGKLNGNLASKPLDLPGKNYLNLSGLFLFIFLTYEFLHTSGCDFGVTLSAVRYWRHHSALARRHPRLRALALSMPFTNKL